MNLTKNKMKPVTTFTPGEIVEEKYNGSNAKFVVFQTKKYESTPSYNRTVSLSNIMNFKYISWGDGTVSLPGDPLTHTYEAERPFGTLLYKLPSYCIIVYGIDNFGDGSVEESQHFITVTNTEDDTTVFDFIESIYFGEGVSIWNNAAATGAYGLIPEQVTANSALSSVSNLSTCPEYAFQHQNYLKNVSFSSDCKEIKSQAFLNCMGLIQIVLPATIQFIAGDAFGSDMDSENHTLNIYYQGSKEDWDKIGYEKSIMSIINIYYYSKNRPTTEGNYWHYVNDEPTVWITEE